MILEIHSKIIFPYYQIKIETFPFLVICTILNWFIWLYNCIHLTFHHYISIALKKSPTSRAEQQAYFLTERMNEYKQAAIAAKRNNDIELAKKYLRIAKVR